MRTLRLASPYMRGADVNVAQARLVKAGYLPKSAHDQVFGPVTANAAKRAKWMLGYAAKNCTPTYGSLLDDYLIGKRKQSAPMRTRAAARKRQEEKQKEQLSIGSRAADRMVRWYQSGWKEYPAGSNQVQPLMQLCRDLKLSAYYSSMGYPWCALAVFVAALAEGSKSAEAGLRRGAFNALYTPTIRQVAENGAHGLRAVSRSSIQHGVCVLFDFGGGNGAEVDHVGIALGKAGETVTAGGKRWECSPNEVVCVEANTSYYNTGSQANGGAVAIRIRPLSLIRTPFTLS
jgi:hypothetical protein